MERQTMERHIETYMTELQLAIHHPILERDVGAVKLAKAKVFFLLLPMLNGEKWNGTVNTAALAVGAVHAGFEAHDVIDELDASSRRQQLGVLAGDYYSGIHYRLLAAIPDFDFIRQLSYAIGQVHETKAEIRNRLPIGTPKLLDAIRTIETGCITQFLHKFGFSNYAQIAAAVLPLLALDYESSVGKESATLDWSIGESEVLTLISTLRAEVDVAIEEADFIIPFLRQEITTMTTAFLGKPI